MKSFLQREAKRLDNELQLVDSVNGLIPYETKFLRLYAQGLTPFRAMQVMHEPDQLDEPLTDLQLKNRALKILKKPAAKKYIENLNAELERQGVATILEMQMFLTAAVRTPIGMLDDTSPLCQKKVTTVKTFKDGSQTETTTLESVSKMDAAKTLIRMKGWDAPVKVDVNHSGGVMMVPMAGSIEDWEKAASASQEKLMAETIDV